MFVATALALSVLASTPVVVRPDPDRPMENVDLRMEGCDSLTTCLDILAGAVRPTDTGVSLATTRRMQIPERVALNLEGQAVE